VHCQRVCSNNVSPRDTEETLLSWANEIFLPDVTATRLKRNKPNQVALLLIDCYSVHLNEKFLTLLADNDVLVLPIEPSESA
jgi:hypothetical protein